MDKSKSEIKDLEVIVYARQLQDWVFRVTSKKPKVKQEEFEDGENNGLPAKYQNSVGTRMQNYTLDILGSLQNARFLKVKRADYLQEALAAIACLNECIWLCFRLKVIRKASAEEGEALLLNVKRMTLAWRQKTMQG